MGKTDNSELSMPDLPAVYAAILCETVESLGHDYQPLLAEIDLNKDDLLNIEASLSPLKFHQLVSAALATTQRPDLGLEFGSRADLNNGLTGRAVLTAPSLLEAIQRGSKYASLSGIGIETDISLSSSIAYISFNLNWARYLPIEQQYFYTEMVLAQGFKNFRFLSGQALCFERLLISYSAPNHAHKYTELFETEVLFDQTENTVCIREEIISMPLRHHCSSVSNQVLMQCEDALAKIPVHQSWVDKTTRLLETYEGEYPDITKAAKQLSTSSRSLTRFLEQENVSYKGIIDKLRLEQAQNLLQQDALSVEYIANKIGFSDASSFRKAFKKWTNKTPSQYRNALKL